MFCHRYWTEINKGYILLIRILNSKLFGVLIYVSVHRFALIYGILYADFRVAYIFFILLQFLKKIQRK
jgi:hypothetical protein